ncbi:peptidase C39-like protein [Herbinix hemicellulosilytica]|uniref:Peptidase C39-like domain-containing protein n=1 Tax=Herbinix hemicellulosilytica TaxID=1564487 RepID=A0A0H5SJT0_HERHM|nr:C39 family peptidase [Herbinix hemicellulosilytica]RBP57240.1 peptidase C39-like protein [Herbinix hemicellulosilytica]CRZ35767.1 hypothetical protein HHT355_2584 [Herbinix hemicellulosilytica]HPU62526.1 C39 family peptidase [Mobilitalea sp.]
MKIPLQYQRTEYDCGPTSLLNAISFLIDREDFPPDILRHCMMYTLDSYNEKGEAYKNGTSKMAMIFLAGWLNEYARVTKFPIYTETLSGKDVYIREGSKIIEALRQGGAVVVRVFLDCGHYITLTGISDNAIEVFDPYYQETLSYKEEISIIHDKPFSANRRVAFDVFNREENTPYALGPVENREAVILFNTNTRKTPEKTIEYFL